MDFVLGWGGFGSPPDRALRELRRHERPTRPHTWQSPSQYM